MSTIATKLAVIASCLCQRRCVRRHRSSNPMPSIPAATRVRARLGLSACGRASDHKGSTGRSASAGEKAALTSAFASSSFAIRGSPSTSRRRIRSAAPCAMKWRISASTHFDCALRGEQMTIKYADWSSAVRICLFRDCWTRQVHQRREIPVVYDAG